MRCGRPPDLHVWTVTYCVDKFSLSIEIGCVDGSAKLQEIEGMLEIAGLHGVEERMAEFFFCQVFNHLTITITVICNLQPVFYIEMNFKKIIGAMEALTIKHQQLNQRFSGKSKGNHFYRGCQQQDQIEDRRVYGRTNKDTIAKFQQIHRRSSQQLCYSSKLLPRKSACFEEAQTDYFQTKNNQRSKTADHRKHRQKHSQERKSSCCFLTAENIFAKNSFDVHKNKNNTISLLNNKPDVVIKNKRLHQKSILKYKQQFHTNFQKDVEIAQRLYSKTHHVIKSKTYIIEADKKQTLKMKENQSSKRSLVKTNNFFSMTQHQNQGCRKITSLNYEKTMKILNKTFLNRTPSEESFAQRQKLKQSQNWKRILQKFDDKSLKIYLINPKDLSIHQFDRSEKILNESIKKLLKGQRFLHLCFILDQMLVHQQFITEYSWIKNSLANSLQILRYFFKRFCCLEDQEQKKLDSLSIKIDQIFKSTKFDIKIQVPFLENSNYFQSPFQTKHAVLQDQDKESDKQKVSLFYCLMLQGIFSCGKLGKIRKPQHLMMIVAKKSFIFISALSQNAVYL